MATPDDTSKPTRRRRGQSQAVTAAADPAPSLGAGDAPPPPRTLEEAIENVRALLMQVRATLHCLSDVLLYSDDDDAVMHAEVAKALEAWVNEAAVELDLVKLKPLIEKIRQGGGEGQSESEPDLANRPYQVRETTPVYLA